MDNKKIEEFSAIKCNQEGSFARFTLKNRLPYIIDKIITDNQFDSRTEDQLLSLKNEITEGVVSFPDMLVSNHMEWNKWAQPYIAKLWEDLPFFFAEVFFYWRIALLTDYFLNKTDPFLSVKLKDIQNNEPYFKSVLEKISEPDFVKLPVTEVLRYSLQFSLWANKADLSQMNRESEGDILHDESKLLIDDSEKLLLDLNNGVSVLDLVLDNAGVELFADLVLCQQLLQSGVVRQIRLHVKSFPFFVSDAVRDDISLLFHALKESSQLYLGDFAAEIEQYIQDDSIIICDHPFWTNPLHFYEMPEDLLSDLSNSGLIIFKGDANYRRLFGDKNIPLDVPVSELIDYLPVPAYALRTLKSEILVGYNHEKADNLYKNDHDWMINGEYGIIQALR